jgi:hypothetical protein
MGTGPQKICIYCYMFMTAWPIITGSGLDDWIYWHLLVQSRLIIISYNNSQSFFIRTLLRWLPRTRSILVLVLRLTEFWSATTDCNSSQSQSYVTTDVQSASLSWCQAPIWDWRPDIFFGLTVAGLLMWGALSDEMTSISFTIYNVQYIYILLVITWIYIYTQYIQGFCQSRLSTADHALFLLAFSYEF